MNEIEAERFVKDYTDTDIYKAQRRLADDPDCAEEAAALNGAISALEAAYTKMIAEKHGHLRFAGFDRDYVYAVSAEAFMFFRIFHQFIEGGIAYGEPEPVSFHEN